MAPAPRLNSSLKLRPFRVDPDGFFVRRLPTEEDSVSSNSPVAWTRRSARPPYHESGIGGYTLPDFEAHVLDFGFESRCLNIDAVVAGMQRRRTKIPESPTRFWS